jgi:hypothetical protein
VEVRRKYKISFGEPERMRPNYRRKDNIKMNLEIVCPVVDWIHLAQDSIQQWNLLNVAVNLQIPQNAANFLTTSATQGVS